MYYGNFRYKCHYMLCYIRCMPASKSQCMSCCNPCRTHSTPQCMCLCIPISLWMLAQ